MTTTNDTLFTMFRPLSPIYSAVMRGRELLYKKETLKSHEMPVPVVSVGNLSMGGTGKTPLVIYLAKLFQMKSFKPAIISRGYKGQANNPVNVVSTSASVLLDSRVAGDEPYLISKSLPNIPVLTGKKRALPCKYAVDKLGCDILILDDGFQHLPVKRNLDLVLFNSSTIDKKHNVFPGGELRESIFALNRCDAIVFTGVEDEFLQGIEAFVKKLELNHITKPIFLIRYGDITIREFPNGTQAKREFDSSSNTLAFSGIGNPHRFKDYLLSNNFNIQAFTPFADHHKYTQDDIDKLEKHAAENQINNMITTEKDAVKLGGFSISLPLFIATPKLIVEKKFDDFIKHKVNLFYKDPF